MKKYLIFDLDGTLIQSNNTIDTLIYNYVSEKIDPELIDSARYIIENNQGMSLVEVFSSLLQGDMTQAKVHANNIYSEINSLENNFEFFPGILEKIKELSKEYTLFLSTGNSDTFAHDILKRGGIHQYFSKILGSSIILKSSQHIEEFIEYIGDENFSKHAVFIGDGQRDYEIAKSKNIDFIHIGTTKKSRYEIPSVININTILEHFNIADN